MARISWKENKVVSIRLRENIYVLAQMLKSPYLLVFKCFNDVDEWRGVELKNSSVLFCNATTKQFFKCSDIRYHKEIRPLENPSVSRHWIKANGASFKAKVWEGTDDELEIIMIGKDGGGLIERDVYDESFSIGKVIKPKISFDDLECINNCELTGQAVYPAFNERLYLCYKFGKNVDPEKELIFGCDLNPEYRRYFKIISGRFKLDELGY